MTLAIPQMIEIDAASPRRADVANLLSAGHVVILRNIDGIRRLRAAMIAYAETQYAGVGRELTAFCESADIPSLLAVLALSRAIKAVRSERFLSRCLAPLIAEGGFAPPVRLDGGIPRLVLPAEIVSAARVSGLFTDEDFKRLSADGPTEIFMPRPANIHRDYNRRHYLLQCNVWFTLHDADEDEVLRIFPQLYRQPIFDMDATEENLRTLGAPPRYRLAFGDAILFHGEHLHTSPSPGGKSGRRLSYDLRIASHNTDDTRHYRDLFLDLRDFPSVPEPAPALGVPASPSVSDSCALPALIALERAKEHSEAELTRIADVFDHFPFAEDRYLILAKHAAQAQLPALAERALQKIVVQSPHAFWVAKAGEALVELNDQRGAEMAFRKALRLTETQAALPDFMPVDYANPPTQPLPETIRRLCEEALSHIGLSPAAVN
jgi:hypothetical protein